MADSATDQPIANVTDAIDIFAEGARLHHRGMFFRNDKMTGDGLSLSDKGVDFIDAHCPEARAVLIPLLHDQDDRVRITAASALIASRPDLARPVIDDIRDHSITEAFASAAFMLAFADTFGEYVMGLCKPDPRYPHPVKVAGWRKPNTESVG